MSAEGGGSRRELRDANVSNARIRALEAGRGHPQALLLIHGFIVTHAAWDDVFDALSERFHVIAPDLPGFGDSEKPSPARYLYGVESFAESMADLLAAFDVGRVHVIGHGLGGAVGLTLAAQHPELVNRLVVVDSLSYAPPLGMKAKLPLYPIVGPFLFKQLYGRSSFRSYFRDDVFPGGVPFDLARVDAFYDKFNSPASRESAYATLRAMLDNRSLVARLGRVRAPTLVVWGREDKLFPVAQASRLARQLEDARLDIMDSGHSPAEERPEQFLRIVSEFLEGRR